MFRSFNAITAQQAWQKLVVAFRHGDGVNSHGSRLGPMREMLHVVLSIEDPRQRWIVCREPAINPAFSIAEVVWIMNGMNEASFLNYFNRSLPKFAGFGPEYYGAYGYRLRQHLGFDQLERAFDTLANRPDSRQVVLQIWDGRSDFPGSQGSPRSPDIPCNVFASLKVRSSGLEWMQVMRSSDLFRGIAYNIVQFTSLQEIMAGWLGIQPGSYNLVTDSLHVYEENVHHVYAGSTIAEVRNEDLLGLARSESTKVFAELAELCRIISSDTSSVADLKMLPTRTGLPRAYYNMVCVLCAEGSRRRGDPVTAREIMSNCNNPVYNRLFDRWLARTCPATHEHDEPRDSGRACVDRNRVNPFA